MPSGALRDELRREGKMDEGEMVLGNIQQLTQEDRMGSGADAPREELAEEVRKAEDMAKYYVKEPEGDVVKTRGSFVVPPGIPKEYGGGSTPLQYALPENAKELQDLIEHRNMNFATGNIFKAIYRLGACDHSTVIYDLNKIIYFAEREKERQINNP